MGSLAEGILRLFSLDFPSARWDSLHFVFLAYRLWISPLPVCEHLVSTTSEGCPYSIHLPPSILSWEWFQDKLWTYCCLWLVIYLKMTHHMTKHDSWHLLLLSSPPLCHPATLTLIPLKTCPSCHPPLLRGMFCLQRSGGKLLIRRDIISQSQGKLNYMQVSGPHSVSTQVWGRPLWGFCGNSLMDSPCHWFIPQLARCNPGWYQGMQWPSWNNEKVSNYMWYQTLFIDRLKGRAI